MKIASANPVTRPALSVITVTFNNAAGLSDTLRSLAALVHKPDEVLVIDALSSDDTAAVVEGFRQRLPIRFISEADDGIYDGMNKGQRLASGDILHYLNAGDQVWGEPYARVTQPALLKTQIRDEQGAVLFEDFIKMDGFGFCHQGLLLPRSHEPYNMRMAIVADLEMIIGTFPQGLRTLPWVGGGGVSFYLGGVSSARKRQRNQEIRDVLRRRLPLLRAWRIATMLRAKDLLPGPVRQFLVKRLRG